MESNGQQDQAPAVVIAYGDEPHQTLSPEWAEGLLRELFATNRKVFGNALNAYVTGERKGTPGRKAGQ